MVDPSQQPTPCARGHAGPGADKSVGAGASHRTNLRGKATERTVGVREDRRVAAACCATADTVPFRVIGTLLRSVCVVLLRVLGTE